MPQLPSLELLEKTHTFPCTYVFKAIGKAESEFVARVVAAAREALAGESDPPYSLRQTPGGRHVAVTLQPRVLTAAQVLAVYDRILHIAGLVLLL